MRLMPTEDELRSRYNPELLKKSTEERDERQEEFDVFVNRLKEYSRSDKPSTQTLSPPIPPPFFKFKKTQRAHVPGDGVVCKT